MAIVIDADVDQIVTVAAADVLKGGVFYIYGRYGGPEFSMSLEKM